VELSAFFVEVSFDASFLVAAPDPFEALLL
jgi:hypothetical protein